jgi:SIR2-like domain
LTIAINDNRQEALRRAALNSDYHLLLGAGASLDSKSPDGKALPNAEGLGLELATRFRASRESGDLLWRLYARAVTAAGERPVYEWLRERFWNVTPPQWMEIYARTPWQTVWTLNIDDTFEQSYKHVRSEASRPLLTVNWDDEFRQGPELSVVHLHGCVDRDQPRRLVFSLSEYASAASLTAAWPLNFRDIYGIYPFVIIGARLADEPDIEAIISNRKPTHLAPSFYVSPHISSAMEKDLHAWNLVPVRMTAEEFSEEWPKLTDLNLTDAPSRLTEIGFRVGSQFRELSTNAPGKRTKGHDFIGGDEPLWIDICENQYAELDWIRQATQDCTQLGRGGSAASAVIYVGQRLTGRSAGLFAIAKQLRSLSYKTFLYFGDGRPDVDAIMQFAADGKPIALLFDSIADLADDAAHLIGRARNAGLNVVCAAVDQVDRTASIVGRFDDAYLVHRRIGTINSRLSSTDAARLVDKLQAIGRLGILEQQKQDRFRREHFRRYGLFDAMAQLENAPAFGRRVGTLIDSIESNKDIELLLIAALASRFGRRLHLMDAGRMLAMDSDVIARAVRDGQRLGAVLYVNHPWVKTRHRWMAIEPCVSRLGSEAALTLLGNAIQRVAARLSRASQRERNATSMLVAAFMTYNNISGIFSSANWDKWYEDLAPTFGTWSARYWEQRAIMSRHIGKDSPESLSRSESFALRAVSIVSDAYSYTTLGTILLAKAAFSPGIDVGEYYDRAIDAFDAAITDDPRNIITWMAFLRHSLDVLKRVRDQEGENAPELRERMNDDWLRIHSQMRTIVNISDTTQEELSALMRRHQTLSLDNTQR